MREIVIEQQRTYTAGVDPEAALLRVRNLRTGDLDRSARSFNLQQGWYDRWVLVPGPSASPVRKVQRGANGKLLSERVGDPYEIEGADGVLVLIR